MCGIAGCLLRDEASREDINFLITEVNKSQKHRGPDGEGVWVAQNRRVGMGHVRLSVIDLSDSASQPMIDEGGNVISFNGEIYNYRELRDELGVDSFRTTSDTEVILKAYQRWGRDCVHHLRGMFAFAIWDPKLNALFVARDRFGIKPLYFAHTRQGFFFASEIKALTPLFQQIETDATGIRDYFSFQFCLGSQTMVSGIQQLEAGHCGYVKLNGETDFKRYWEVYYDLDWGHTEHYFVAKLEELIYDSIDKHLRADVDVGSYVSGGVDSSLMAGLARKAKGTERAFHAFNGRFDGAAFDESEYAIALARKYDMELHVTDICEDDFLDNISDVIYHLDQPIAGPGSFPQFMVSKEVKKNLKVVLGGQGGDEVFGGYARYLLAYFEQCLKGAIEGSMDNGNYVVTYESIIPNLKTLEQYKPLMREFWSEGLFEERDRRYFRLINRSNNFSDAIAWENLGEGDSFERFRSIYWGSNVGQESYFDSMTHFDFKTLLPALLQVEDRMSMAHGIESRVPLLDHPLVEFAATIPSSVKFKNGELKRLLRSTFKDVLPTEILERKDKMGFPVPLQQWLTNSKSRTREFLFDTFNTNNSKERAYLGSGFDIASLVDRESVYGRNVWAFLSLELWQQRFHDSQRRYRFVN